MPRTWSDIYLEGMGLRRRLSEAEKREQYTSGREQFDRNRQWLSPLGGQAKETPQPPRKASRP
jgi:hypothetical protein